jgi:hypothetical protein
VEAFALSGPGFSMSREETDVKKSTDFDVEEAGL